MTQLNATRETRRITTKKLVYMGLLTAISVVLVMCIHFSIVPAAPYLEYDPADIPVLIGAFLFGPWMGLALAVVVSVIQGLTVSAGAGIIGIVMHIFATGIMVIVSGLIYRRNHSMKGAVVALIAGALAMTASMLLWNAIITPFYTGMPREVVLTMLIPVFLPFNLIKAGINCLITFLVYKPISKLYKR